MRASATRFWRLWQQLAAVRSFPSNDDGRDDEASGTHCATDVLDAGHGIGAGEPTTAAMAGTLETPSPPSFSALLWFSTDPLAFE